MRMKSLVGQHPQNLVVAANRAVSALRTVRRSIAPVAKMTMMRTKILMKTRTTKMSVRQNRLLAANRGGLSQVPTSRAVQTNQRGPEVHHLLETSPTSQTDPLVAQA